MAEHTARMLGVIVWYSKLKSFTISFHALYHKVFLVHLEFYQCIKYVSGVLFGVYARVRLFAHSILPVCVKKKNRISLRLYSNHISML